MDISHRAYKLVDAQPDGLLSRQAAIDAGITMAEAKHAYISEWQRKLDLENVLPGIPIEDVIQACAEIEEHNREVSALAAFWSRLEQTLEGDFDKSPWIRLSLNEIDMHWSDDVHASLVVPTMIMDACLPADIVRRFFPHMQGPTEAVATMPHAFIRQITDRTMSRSMFVPKEGAREKDRKTCANNITKLRWLIEFRAAQLHPGTLLTIVQKDVEDALLSWNSMLFRRLVSLVHFNDLTGLNQWADVAGLIVVGRTEPAPGKIEGIARAVFGAEVVEAEPDEHGRVLYPR
jgi:hypothetical protein